MPAFQPIPDLPGVDLAREKTREYLAYSAVGGFFLILSVIVVVGWMVLGAAAEDVLKVLTATAGVLSGIVGAIIGFYFRSAE